MPPPIPVQRDDSPSANGHDILVVRRPDGGSDRLPLNRSELIVGRSANVDLTLAHDTVSRRHARIYKDPFGRWWICDLESHNGTFVAGERVKEVDLTSGAAVNVGPFVLQVIPVAGTSTRIMADQSSATLMTAGDAATDRLSFISQVRPPAVSSQHLSAITEFGRSLLSIAEPEARWNELGRLMVNSFSARHAMSLTITRTGDGPVNEVLVQQRIDAPNAPPSRGIDGPQPYVSRTLCEAVLQRGEPTMATSGARSAHQPLTPQAVEMSIASGMNDAPESAAIACPLSLKSASTGSLDLLYVTLEPKYATGEWLALVDLCVRQFEAGELSWAGRAQAAELAQIEGELRQAEKIQRSLVPDHPALTGLDTAIVFRPCRWVGGDYADALTMPDGRGLLIVADVCGKGLQAALTSSALHTLVHAMSAAGSSLAEIGHRMNDHLAERLEGGQFVTFVGVAVDPVSGDVSILNAGHPPVMRVRPGQAAEPLAAGINLPMGVQPGPMEIAEDKLAVGEYLVLYSDGVNELKGPDGAMVGVDGVQRLAEDACAGVADQTADGARAAADHLVAALEVRLAGSSPDDDLSLLIARRQ